MFPYVASRNTNNLKDLNSTVIVSDPQKLI